MLYSVDLYKLVLAAEEEKYESKMDRKTLKRLCETLNRAGVFVASHYIHILYIYI